MSFKSNNFEFVCFLIFNSINTDTGTLFCKFCCTFSFSSGDFFRINYYNDVSLFLILINVPGTSFLVLISFHFLFLILLSIGSNDVRQRKSGNENSANKEEEEEGTKQIQFDIEEIKQIKTDFHKESGFQKAVQFSRDHSILATGGSDGYLRVWKVTSSLIFSTPR